MSLEFTDILFFSSSGVTLGGLTVMFWLSTTFFVLAFNTQSSSSESKVWLFLLFIDTVTSTMIYGWLTVTLSWFLPSWYMLISDKLQLQPYYRVIKEHWRCSDRTTLKLNAQSHPHWHRHTYSYPWNTYTPTQLNSPASPTTHIYVCIVTLPTASQPSGECADHMSITLPRKIHSPVNFPMTYMNLVHLSPWAVCRLTERLKILNLTRTRSSFFKLFFVD